MQDPLGNKISPGEQISLMLQKNSITEVPPNSPGFYSNVFLRRVASSNRFKKSECSHLCISFSYVHYKLSAEYRAKRRLHIQDRPAGCVLSCTNSSKQQEVPQVCLQKKGFLWVLPFSLNTAPQIFTRLGHTVTGYLHRLGISVIPYLDNGLVHHPDRQVLLQHQTQLLKMLDLAGFILNRKKSMLDLVQDIQFLGIRAHSVGPQVLSLWVVCT